MVPAQLATTLGHMSRIERQTPARRALLQGVSTSAKKQNFVGRKQLQIPAQQQATVWPRLVKVQILVSRALQQESIWCTRVLQQNQSLVRCRNTQHNLVSHRRVSAQQEIPHHYLVWSRRVGVQC